MEVLNTGILAFASAVLLILLGLTIWALKVIMDVRSNCGACQVSIKSLGSRQDAMEERQDLLEASNGDLQTKVAVLDKRVYHLEK